MNLRGLLQGQGGYGLLPEGLEDAERAAAALRGEGVSLVYSSDLQRALETAAVLRRGLQLRAPVRRSRALREFDYGRFSGRPVNEVQRLCPQFRRDAAFVFPGGESYVNVQARALRWLEGLLKRHRRGAVAVVSHGGWLRSLFAGLRGLPLNQCLGGNVPHGPVGRLDVHPRSGLRLTVSPAVTIFPESL